ncbi:MAG: GNAT family N-acetyltransferase, partial [Candidatus Thorarchaeota archaeon]
MNRDNYLIRKATKADLIEIKKICVDGFPDDDAYEIAKTLIDIQHYYVAEDNETKRILGFIAFGIHSVQASHIIILAVSTECQRNGIGTSLLNYSLRIIEKTNSKRVRLEVRISNLTAISF